MNAQEHPLSADTARFNCILLRLEQLSARLQQVAVGFVRLQVPRVNDRYAHAGVWHRGSCGRRAFR